MAIIETITAELLGSTDNIVMSYVAIVSTMNMVNMRRWAKDHKDRTYITPIRLLRGDIDVGSAKIV